MMLTFDNRSFEDAAKALLVINPAIINDYTLDSMITIMRGTAYQIYHSDPKANYCSTWGFVLTFYDVPDGRKVIASISPSVINSYIENNKVDMAP
jgi:hypothetical protein